MERKTITSKTIPVRSAIGEKTNAVDVDVYYSIGGMNPFSYKNEPRGYYISVTPVCRRGYVVEWDSVFAGRKHLLKEVTRQSKKAEAESIELAAQYERTIVDIVCREYGLEVIE